MSQAQIELSDLKPSLEDLLRLAQRERKKEDELLDFLFDVYSSEPREDARRIMTFNTIYQKKAIFERNLTKIKNIAAGGKQGKVDVTSVFRSYLDREWRNFLSENISVQDLTKEQFLEVIKKALLAMFRSADDPKMAGQEEAMRSYMELAEMIEIMKLDDPFIEEVFDLYFGKSWEKLQQQLTSKRKKSIKPDTMITGSTTMQGNLFETVQTLILNSIGMDAKHTGKSGQKTDITIATFDIDLDFEVGISDESARERFVLKYQEFYEKLKKQKQQGYIVEISAKNYDLNSYWFKKNGGFTAQGSISIKNFAATLIQYGFKSDKVDPLVFALLNTGSDTLLQDTEYIERYISTLIAYFLFDDIDMDTGLDVSAVHLFNLDGVYVPLSCFLFAAYKSLSDIESFSREYVSTIYEPQEIGYQKQEVLTYETWERVKDKKMEAKDLSIHFFGNFANYISKLL